MEINSGGVWRTSQKVYVAVGGVWRTGVKASIVDNGAWRLDTTLGSLPRLTSWTVAADPTYPYSAIRFTYGAVENDTASYPVVTVGSNANGYIYAAKASAGGFRTWKDQANRHPRPGYNYTIALWEDSGSGNVLRPDLTRTITLPQLPAPTNLQVTSTGAENGSPQIKVTWDSQYSVGIRQYSVSVSKQTIDGKPTGQQPQVLYPYATNYTFAGTPGAQYRIEVAGLLYNGVIGNIASTTYYQARGYTPGFYAVTPVYAKTWSTGKRLWRDIANRRHGDKYDNHRIQHTSFFYWPSESTSPYGSIQSAINAGGRITSLSLRLECTLKHTNPIGVYAQQHTHRTFTPLTNDVPPTLLNNRTNIGQPQLGQKTYSLPVEWAYGLLGTGDIGGKPTGGSVGYGITIGNISLAPTQTIRSYLEFTSGYTPTGQLLFYIS